MRIFKKRVFILLAIIVLEVILLICVGLNYRIPNAEETVYIKFVSMDTFNAVCEFLNRQKYDIDVSEEKTIALSNGELRKIDNIDLSNHNLGDIKGLKDFIYLKQIDLSNNNISDISDLSGMDQLEVINLSGNIISDISPLKGLRKCKVLNLARNKLFENENREVIYAQFFSEMYSLEFLNLSHNYILYTDGFEALGKIKELNFYDNSIRDIGGLRNLLSLECLNLGENIDDVNFAINGLEVLNELSSLKELDFSNNNTSDICGYLKDLNSLKTLQLEGNNIQDISGLNNLNNLEVLILYNNEIEDIAVLQNLKDLRELNLQKNNINDIHALTNLDKLRKLSIAENSIAAENSGDITLLKNRFEDDGFELNYEELIDTLHLPHVDGNGCAYVTYEDFGARCDGVYDDFIAIKMAHTYANLENCEVRAEEGAEYHIFKLYEDSVDIKTNANWKNARFIIHDENIDMVSGRHKNLFRINNFGEPIRIIAPDWTVAKNQKEIPQLVEAISTVKDCDRFFVKICNQDKRQYIRYGGNANDGLIQQDYFLIDRSGIVLNNIQWDFEKITDIEVYPIVCNSQTLWGGIFVSMNISNKCEAQHTRSDSGKNNYYERNIYIYHAGNVNILNLKHILPNDTISGSYHGFIYTDEVSDFSLINSNLIARKYSIRATYDLNLWATVNAEINGVVCNGIEDADRWGVVATYYSKDICFNNCELNRIDAHEGIYNLSVNNCTIGLWGLELTGQGLLKVIHTEVVSPTFITLRNDYGSTWNGRCYIENCKYVPHKATRIPRMFSVGFSFDSEGDEHDFGYDTKFPDVYIDGLIIDLKYHPEFQNVAIIPNEEEYGIDLKEYWPSEIIANDIRFVNYDMANNPQLQLKYKEDSSVKGNYLLINIYDDSLQERNFVWNYMNNDKSKLPKELIIAFNGDYFSCNNEITIIKDGYDWFKSEGNDFCIDMDESGEYIILVESYRQDGDMGKVEFDLAVE